MGSKEYRDFAEISKKIYNNFNQHEKNLKELCMKKSVISLAEFKESLQVELKKINSDETPSKDRCSIIEYADLYKTIDDYPSNLQKPKKPSSRDAYRVNRTISMESSMTGNAPATSTSCTSLNASKTEKQPLAKDIYSEFKKFQQKLRKLVNQLEDTHMITDYMTKLQQLQNFGEQLQKLLPPESFGMDAFNEKEEETLQCIVRNMEELNFIQHNRCLFQNLGSSASSLARLQSIVNVLTYCLQQCYNNV